MSIQDPFSSDDIKRRRRKNNDFKNGEEEEIAREAYELVKEALSLIQDDLIFKQDYYYDRAIEALRDAIGLYSQINRFAEIKALNEKISELYNLKESE